MSDRVSAGPARLPPDENRFAQDVVILCSQQDKLRVNDEMLPPLQAARLKCGLRDLDFEDPDGIRRALETSRYALAVLTPDCLNSHWPDLRGLFGTDGANAAGGCVLPVLLQPCERPEEIASLPYADLTVRNRRDEDMNRLLKQLRSEPPPSRQLLARAGADARTAAAGRQKFDQLVAMLEWQPALAHETKVHLQIYRERLKEKRAQIDVLNQYKKMHALLHDLQCPYRQVWRELQRPPETPFDWREMVDCRKQIGERVEGLQRVTRAESLGERGKERAERLIARLQGARKELDKAIRTRDRQQLGEPRRLLRTVLSTYPNEISADLRARVDVLQMHNLISVIEDVTDRERADLRILADEAEQLMADTLAALRRLDRELKRLIHQHDDWQRLEQRLSLIEEQSENGIDEKELRKAWPDLKEDGLELYGDSLEPWAHKQRQEADRLAGVLNGGPADQISVAFSNYRAELMDQFYCVDLDLLELCDKLGDVFGTPEPASNRRSA
jgi:hypothetical protein